MFKKAPRNEETREEILDSALELFRQRGFDATTMRDIAAKADVALGAAYYYFVSKDAIVQAYYEKVQEEHTASLRQMDSAGRSLKERLAAVFHSKLDILQNDRKLLGAIFRYSGEPAHPLSCLGPGTKVVREQSMQVIADAITPDELPPDLQQLLTLGLWALQMGVLIYFIYDESPQQQRTRKLVDRALEITTFLLRLARFPLLGFARKKVLALLDEAGLLPQLNHPLEAQS
jgi:AcrR family transcriptional regulator